MRKRRRVGDLAYAVALDELGRSQISFLTDHVKTATPMQVEIEVLQSLVDLKASKGT